ncbi:MAG: RNA methyltransferase [Bacteroidota bacterium]
MKPLSKARLKLFTGLKAKKNRYRQRLFLVEGIKMVREALESGWAVEAIILEEGFDRIKEVTSMHEDRIFVAEKSSFSQLSTQQQSEGVLAILHMPDPVASGVATVSGPGFLLEEIQDPGNMGTLIRTAAWFGFSQIICSKGCVDLYNPKVLRASMGAIFKVHVQYVEDLLGWVREKGMKVLVADMEGKPVEEYPFEGNEYVLIGNEAHGVQAHWKTHPEVEYTAISGGHGVESLNAAISGAIFAYEIGKKRRKVGLASHK